MKDQAERIEAECGLKLNGCCVEMDRCIDGNSKRNRGGLIEESNPMKPAPTGNPGIDASPPKFQLEIMDGKRFVGFCYAQPKLLRLSSFHTDSLGFKSIVCGKIVVPLSRVVKAPKEQNNRFVDENQTLNLKEENLEARFTNNKFEIENLLQNRVVSLH
ncbi:MAG: hypothetical protein HKP58_07060 [Desulfatitalea sp.]|nr:hypothetical protein [Desulfatitalea sp.]